MRSAELTDQCSNYEHPRAWNSSKNHQIAWLIGAANCFPMFTLLFHFKEHWKTGEKLFLNFIKRTSRFFRIILRDSHSQASRALEGHCSASFSAAGVHSVNFTPIGARRKRTGSCSSHSRALSRSDLDNNYIVHLLLEVLANWSPLSVNGLQWTVSNELFTSNCSVRSFDSKLFDPNYP